MKKTFYILLLFLCCFNYSFAQRSKSVQPENKIRNYVTDKTGTLTSSEAASLETKLSDFDKQTSTQIVVFILGTLDGGSLEEKSIEIAEQNGVGKKSKNNGALLFIVKDDRKLRIEVGYGLEGALPDALCDQIIRKEITPQFKQGNYYAGINAGVDAILKATKGEYTQDTKSNSDPDIGPCGIPIVIFIIFVFVGFFIVIGIMSRFCRFFGGGRSHIGSSGGWLSSGSSWGSSGSSFSGGGFSGGGG